MPFRLALALLAIVIGAIGLALDFYVIAGVMGPPQNRPLWNFLVWWLALPAHGTLRYRDVPLMLLPGLAYVLYIELRGPLAGEYPYTILDPGYAPPGGTAAGPLTVAISVGVLVVLVAIFDLLLVFIDGLIDRRRQAASRGTA